MSDAEVAIASLATLGTISAGFFAQARQQNKTHDRIAKGLNDLVKVHTRGNKEAEARNGHLAELVTQGSEQTKALAEGAVKTILEAVKNVPEQHIEHAHVEHQEVKQAIINETPKP